MTNPMHSSQRHTRWNKEDQCWETTLRGRAILSDSRLNKGTAFTWKEREELDLIGLLPPQVLTIDRQVVRSYRQYSRQPSDLAKNVFLNGLFDRSEVLFYRLLMDHLEEMLPIAYTPTIGEAIQRFSHEYRRPRGVYLSVDKPEDIETALMNGGRVGEDVDLVLATDAEAILGIGDWGTGGIEIAIGKLIVYTAAAGIDPRRTLAVMLDVGTNRQELLDDPEYLGVRHARVDRETYDKFIDQYVDTATRLFPNAMLHWEDFGTSNARRILDRYKDSVLTFNDDMQGTGAVNLAAVLSAAKVSGVPLRDQRVVIYGSGTAGIGIADQLRDAMVADGLSHDEATRRFWCIGRHGLLTDARDDLRDFQVPYARPADESSTWVHDESLGGVSLEEVVRQVQPTVLIGTSGIARAFTESIVREMARHVGRPIIMPMSNPTSLAEALPADLLEWTEGRALVATGSPFKPVEYEGREYRIAQANNALVFPGLGLGIFVAQASRLTDGMLQAAARAVAELVHADELGSGLLPQIRDLRATSAAVAVAVARQAEAEGLARVDLPYDLESAVFDRMWKPDYPPVRPI